ncbi:MAG: hypothetical protein ACOC6E_00990 [Thermodesulfobacteriota bacterium]
MVGKEVPQNSNSYSTPPDNQVSSATNHIAFNFGSNAISIQSTIATNLLKTNNEETAQSFEELCRAFSEVCDENEINLDPVDLLILQDKEIERGGNTKFRDAEDGTPFAEILISINDFQMHEYWKYTFLHELGHAWLSVELSKEDKESGYGNLFIDLIAICTFRKILPPKKWVYHEVRRHRPFFLTQQTKRFLGKELYRQILQAPEGYLRDLREKIYS